MFDSLKKFLFPAKASQHDVEHLRPIDVDLVAEELDVFQSGNVDGRKNYPDSGDLKFSLCEVQITGLFQDEAQAAAKYFRGKIIDLQKFLRQKSLGKYSNRLLAIVPAFKASMDAKVAQSKPNLIALKQNENDLHDGYMLFRRAHHLTQSADYPESKFFLVTILIGILLIEAILNGYFFAQANEFGLVGGVSQATITAGINIAIGWLFGRFAFTQLNHYNKVRRYTTFAIVPILFVCVIIFYNLFIGHFRDMLAITIDTDAIAYGQVSQDVLSSVLNNPFGLQSFDSWLLVLLGLVFSLIAASDGYNFDDAYPGYGRVARRFEIARSDYNEDKQVFLDDLADLLDDYGDEVDSIKFNIEAQSRSIHDILAATKKCEGEHEGYMRDLDNKCNHVLQLYRASNRKVRKSQSPAYFDNDYELTESLGTPNLEPFDTSELLAQLASVDDLLKNVSKVALDVDKAYSKEVGKINKELEEIEA